MEKQNGRKSNVGSTPEEQVKTTVQKLKKSPIFNMSLTSKELFHSNFIAWMLEAEDVNSDALLELFFEEDPERPKLEFDQVEREISNFDIRIWLKDKRSVVIENKVKSLPDEDQLRKYSESLTKKKNSNSSDTTCVLLSLTEPAFFKGKTDKIISDYNWRFVSYEKLVDALKKIKPANGYHKNLIEDYSDFIGHLGDLRKACEEHWGKVDQLLSYHDKFYDHMKGIRLHDIYEKWRMEALRRRLEKKGLSGVVLTVDYTRGAGILNIDPKGVGENSFFTKLQIQGNQLRQVVQYRAEKKGGGNKGIFEKADALNGWFVDKDGNPLPKNTKKTEKKTDLGFCKYDSNFVYLYEKKGEWDLDRVIELSKELDADISKEK